MGYNKTNLANLRPEWQELVQIFSKNKPYRSELDNLGKK